MRNKDAKKILEDKLYALHYTADQLKNVNEIKNVIREISDNDDYFENMIFELGCSVLARHYNKIINKEID